MGCRNEYLKSTAAEKELSKVVALLDEVKFKKPIPKNYGDGNDPRAYGQEKDLHQKTEELCLLLQPKSQRSIKLYSLELQVWWRDHRALDRKRLREEKDKARTAKARRELIEALTPYERKLLNLKD